MEKQFYDCLRKKTILISSISFGGLERYIIQFFELINKTYHLQITLYVCNGENADYLENCSKEVDIFLHTGICNYDVKETKDSYHALDISFFKVCEKVKPKQIILLTDYRMIEPNIKIHQKTAEGEIYGLNPIISNYTASLQITLETMCVSVAHQYGAEYFIIRTGALLGSGIDGCGNIQKMINKGEVWDNIVEINDVVPYLYISDFLQSMLIVLNSKKKNEIYHAIHPKMLYSGYEILGILYRITGEKPSVIDIKSTGHHYLMAGEKLQLKGFHPQVDMEQAILILRQHHFGNIPEVYQNLYNGKIHKIQKLVLAVMIEIDKLCRKHQIPYALGGGTLLGAVRHQGFIPWDEDADLIMERDAYEKFLDIASKELPDWLFLQTPKTDKENHFYTKVRIHGTMLATKFTSKIPELHQGIFVDIFCHDKTSKYRIMQKVHLNVTIIARSMVFNKWGNTPIAGKDERHTFIRKVFTIIKNILPMPVLEKFQFWVITFYKNKDTGYLYDGMGQNIRNGAFPQVWLKDRIMADFETYQFPIPKEYHNYLTFLYGDYQKMIPVRNRFDDSYAKRVDLGKYF